MNEVAGSLGFDPGRLARIDQWMQRYVDSGRYSGASVLIARDGHIAHISTAGLRSIDQNRAYERDTIVRIYSMTKMIATVGFMMLVERGLVHLGMPLAAILPEFSSCHALVEGAERPDQVEPVESPTLHHLLTHTSGMTYSFNPGILAAQYEAAKIGFGPEEESLDAACKRLATLPLAFRPGSAWQYSVGIDVIGRVIEVLSGKPLDAYLREMVFEPLEMVDTAFHVPHDKVVRFADCYSKTDTELLRLVDRAATSGFIGHPPRAPSGGGGLVSTLDDYFRFGEMIRRYGEFDGGRLLSSRTVAFMRRNHLTGDIASLGTRSFAEMPMVGVGFGLGGAVTLDPARNGSPGSVGDFGWGGMASTNFWTDPVERLTCIFFTQLIPSSSYPNRAELKALIHGALVH